MLEKARLVIVLGALLGFVLSCVSAPPEEAAPPQAPRVSDDHRLVPLPEFLPNREWLEIGALQDWSLENGELRIQSTHGWLVAAFTQSDVLRLQAGPGLLPSADQAPVGGLQSWEYRPLRDVRLFNDSGAVLESRLQGDVPPGLYFRSARLELRIQSDPLLLSVHQGERVLFSQSQALAFSGTRSVSFQTLEEGAAVYGLGEAPGSLDRRGQGHRLWNQSAGGESPASALPVIQILGGTQRLGLFLDNSYQSYFSFAQDSPDTWWLGTLNGGLDLHILGQGQPEEILQAYTRLTGRAELPPRWTLGYLREDADESLLMDMLAWQDSQEDGEPEAGSAPEAESSVGVGILSARDGAWARSTGRIDNAGWGRELNQRGWRAEALVLSQALAELPESPGLRFILGLNPGREGLESLARLGVELPRAETRPGRGPVDGLLDSLASGGAGAPEPLVSPDGLLLPGAFPDFSRPLVDQWWAEALEELQPLGYRFFRLQDPALAGVQSGSPAALGAPGPEGSAFTWETRHWDEGRQSLHARNHNLYAARWAASTWESLPARSSQRPFLVQRSGYAGLQRYGAKELQSAPAGWEGLRAAIPALLNLSLSGVGHGGTGLLAGPLDDALWRLRSFQLASLFPLFLGQEGPGVSPGMEALAQAAGQSSRGRGSNGPDPFVATLQLRYSLTPYWYALLRDHSLQGLPPVRPLFWHFSRDEESRNVEDQFMIGTHIMAAPLLEAGAISRDVYLPAGSTWFDYHSGREFRGGMTINYEAPLDRIPLFVRGGAIIPTWEANTALDLEGEPQVEYRVYPGGQGRQIYYHDDGNSQAYRRGAYQEREIVYSSFAREMEIEQRVIQGDARSRRRDRYYLVRLYNVYRPREVLVEGRPIRVYGDSFGVIESDQSAAWYENNNSLLIKVFEVENNHRVSIRF